MSDERWDPIRERADMWSPENTRTAREEARDEEQEREELRCERWWTARLETGGVHARMQLVVAYLARLSVMGDSMEEAVGRARMRVYVGNLIRQSSAEALRPVEADPNTRWMVAEMFGYAGLERLREKVS